LDETGFVAHTHRSHGRALKGKKVHGLQNANQRPRTSLIGAYCNNRLLAPVLFEGTCNTQLFNTWLGEQLLPQLQCGSVIVMDNAAFHKSEETRRLIEDAACDILFLPPYSPDLNPIEKLWANLKKLRREKLCDIDSLIKESNY
jgi:transposase